MIPAPGSPSVTEPRGFPIVGHLPLYLRDRLGFLAGCDDGSGRPVRLRLGATAYLLTDPADVEHVLLRNFRNYTKTPRLTSRRGRRLLGHGVLTSVGAEHLERRRALQPLFARRRVAAFEQVVTGVVDEVAARWEEGAVIDVAAEMTTLTRRAILRTLLGRRPDEAELECAVDTRERYLEYHFKSLAPAPELVPRPIVLAHRRARRQIERVLRSAISAARGGDAAGPELVSQLVATRAADGTGLSDDDVRDELLVPAVTGYETLAAALAWTWYLLALHAEEEARVHHDADGLRGRAPRAEDLPALAATEAALSEAMRLYPPTWLFVRVALAGDRLPSGLELRRGAKLYLSQYVIHRSPRFFPAPERFDPSRFESEARASRPEFSYFPFGGGVRLCIGKPFALMEGVLAIAAIAARYRLSLEPGARVTAEPGVTLRPQGLRMRVHAR